MDFSFIYYMFQSNSGCFSTKMDTKISQKIRKNFLKNVFQSFPHAKGRKIEEKKIYIYLKAADATNTKFNTNSPLVHCSRPRPSLVLEIISKTRIFYQDHYSLRCLLSIRFCTLFLDSITCHLNGKTLLRYQYSICIYG